MKIFYRTMLYKKNANKNFFQFTFISEFLSYNKIIPVTVNLVIINYFRWLLVR